MTDPTPAASVTERLDGLRTSIDDQGRRVFDLVLQAVEAYFDADVPKAELLQGFRRRPSS